MEEYQLEQRRRKILCHLASELQDLQRTIISRRRRKNLKVLRQQTLLRRVFMQQFMEFQTSYLEVLSLKSIFREHQLNDDAVKQANVAEESTTTPPKEIETNGFYQLALNSFTDAQWLQAFRMSRRTFRWLCEELREETDETVVPLPLEQRMALALYAFANDEDIRVTALLFNVTRSIVCTCVRHFSDDLLEHFGATLLTMPKDFLEYIEISKNFQRISGMPPVVAGVLGVCEIPHTMALDDNKDGTTTEKDLQTSTSDTILLHCIIDDQLLFRQAQVNNEPCLLLEEDNDVSELKPQTYGKYTLDFCVIAPNYPLRPWMYHSFTEPRSPNQVNFNKAVKEVLTVRDTALKRLFGRWRILRHKKEAKVMERIVMACCALHNLLEETEEEYLAQWHDDIDEHKWRSMHFPTSHHASEQATRKAQQKRQLLARALSDGSSSQSIDELNLECNNKIETSV